MRVLLTGNEAIARGAYEAGVSYASAYPGTPSTEILENLASYKGEVVAEWAVNEKVALESAIGASIAGARSLTAMKHVGVNVAADPLLTFATMGCNAGMVLVSADDPGMHSSQNEQDNRYYAKFCAIPMLEPSDSQEAKDMVAAAMELGERFDTAVLMRMTTRICHSKSPVEEGPVTPAPKKPYTKRPEKFFAVPAVARQLHEAVERRRAALEEYAEGTELNRTEWNDTSVGVISSGVAYQYAREVFGKGASYLKLGLSFPLPMKKIAAFAAKVGKLYVVEELEPFIEEQVKAAGIECVGKALLPRIGELNPAIIAERILGRKNAAVGGESEAVVPRPPVLCAGCPHRGLFFELSKLKNVMVTSDIGCYSLGSADPLNAGDTCVCMGASVSLGHGANQAFRRFGEATRAIGVIGDSTFFHTGMSGLLSAVYNKSDSITCILDNRITAMTGHQENPGTGYTLQGDETTIVEIEPLVRALGVRNVRTVNPLKLAEVHEALAWALALCAAQGAAHTGPTVIVTRWPCVLKRPSRQDKAEFGDWKALCTVDESTCIGCRLCTKTGCPALVFKPAKKKMSIDAAQCVGCEVCAQVCPKGAIKREERKHA